MKKVTALVSALLSVLSLAGCANSPKVENPYRIKTQIHETYHLDRTQTIRTEYIYDENGWLVETQTFKDNDEWWYTTKFILDENGNNHGSETVAADGTQSVERMLTLDDQGRMLTSESHQNGEVTATTEYGYNEAGQVTKLYINRLNALGGNDLKSFVDSTYDSNGNLSRQDIRWEPSNNQEHTLYTYKNDKIQRTETFAGDNLNCYSEYTYDETGLVQTAIERSVDETLQSKHITTYDEYGNPLEVLAFAYVSEQARLGKAEDEPNTRTTNIYEEIGS